MLFHETIFGPIHSRRLGTSLGVNLTPNDGKICSFDCLYCEAGLNSQGPGTTGFAPRERVARLLEDKLREMNSRGESLDVITFSGNGEPTLHPEFPAIMDDVIALRDRYYPEAKVSVLNNSTRIFTPEMVDALKRADNNILKLDSAIDDTIRVLDRPNQPGFTARRVIEGLKAFSGTGIIQTMMLTGRYDGVDIDNTTDDEVRALIEAYREIGPRQIMLYSIDRPTPVSELHKIPIERLGQIGARIEAATGIPVSVN